MLGLVVSLGSVSGFLTFAAIVVAGWYVVRGGGGTALSTLKDANEVLERRVREQEDTIKQLQSKIRVLEARTDIGVAMKPIADAVLVHEENAGKRHESVTHALELITSSLEKLAA